MEPGPTSDYDFMVPLADRDRVMNHLSSLEVDYSGGAKGSIKLALDSFPLAPSVRLAVQYQLIVNICFIETEDGSFEAWKKAHDVMWRMEGILGGSFFQTLSKPARMELFSELVVQFGGQRPYFPHGTSSP